MADISALGVVSAAERGADLTLKHPATGEDLDIVMEVLGFDAEVVVQASRAFDRAEAGRKRADDEDDPRTRRNIALASVAVTGWRNLQMKGKDVKFSAEKCADIMADPNYVWILNQVVAFGSIRRNFFPQKSGE